MQNINRTTNLELNIRYYKIAKAPITLLSIECTLVLDILKKTVYYCVCNDTLLPSPVISAAVDSKAFIGDAMIVVESIVRGRLCLFLFLGSVYICNHTAEEDRLCCLSVIVFLLPCWCLFSVSLPRIAIGWSVAWYCGIFSSVLYGL